MNERTIRVRGGHRFTVRSMAADDGPAVAAAFGRLSPSSLRTRFFSPVLRLTPGVVADLTAVDDRHLVLLAFDAAGELVAGARATRRLEDPSVADVAVTVGDHVQGRGLGTKLLRLLRTEAASAGVERFAGQVLVDNPAAQAMLVSSRAAMWVDEPGVLGFEIPLGPRTVAPEIDARRRFGLAS